MRFFDHVFEVNIPKLLLMNYESALSTKVWKIVGKAHLTKLSFNKKKSIIKNVLKIMPSKPGI